MQLNDPNLLSRESLGRALSVLLIGVILFDSQIATAEPLGYVLRPARQDIGVMDGRRNTVLGAVEPTSTAEDNIGDLNFARISPNGRFGLIGATNMGLNRLDVLSGHATGLADLGANERDSFDATAAAFSPDSKIAYISVRSTGSLLEVDTSTDRMEILRSWDAPVYRRLFYMSIEDKPTLIGLQDDGGVSIIDPVLGQVSEPLLPFNHTVDLTVLPDNTAWALSDSGRIFRLSGFNPEDAFSNITVLLARARATTPAGPAEHLAVDEKGQVLYFSGPEFAFMAECIVAAGTELERRTLAAPCTATGESLRVTEISLGTTDDPNPIGDVTLAPGDETLYVVGRRTIFSIDTATANLVAGFRMKAGGGELGQMTIGEAVAPCVPQSTSILALRGEALAMNTSRRSRNKVHAKLKKAQNDLAAGDIAAGRSALQSAIARTTVRSNLPPGNTDHIPPDEASSVICAAGNLLERVRIE